MIAYLRHRLGSWCRWLRRSAPALGIAAATLLLAAAPLGAQSAASADAALERLLAEAQATLPAACGRPGIDRLQRILCERKIRIGARSYYPLFSTFEGETRQGYEIDIAGLIGHRLGVDVDIVRVNAASRIPLLAEDRVDLTIATMGHNNQRDGQARFIRPHYYRSESVLVGPRELVIDDWGDIVGRTVCVTIGNGSNTQIVSQGARLMLFEEAGTLVERLKDRTCTLAVQDDSFFAFYFTDPAFAERFEAKLGFAQVPWGMAVARQGSERLAQALDLLSRIFHRDGVFLESARTNRIATGFLETQQALWRSAACGGDADADPACLLPALDTALPATPFAAAVTRFERAFERLTGIELALPMLKTAPAWSLLQAGIVNSLILVAGALAGTLTVALAFGAALATPRRWLRWPVRAAISILQSSPIVLTLVIAAALAQAIAPYSSTVAIVAAILALGLANGGNAGQALAEAVQTLRAEHAESDAGTRPRFADAIARSGTQLVAFLINAAKGTPIASFIGAPELLSALTDITAFASARATTYSLLLIYYIVLVTVVVMICNRLRTWLERGMARP